MSNTRITINDNFFNIFNFFVDTYCLHFVCHAFLCTYSDLVLIQPITILCHWRIFIVLHCFTKCIHQKFVKCIFSKFSHQHPSSFNHRGMPVNEQETKHSDQFCLGNYNDNDQNDTCLFSHIQDM